MNGSGFPADFLDSVVKFFDFPLENVEAGYWGDCCHDDGGCEELHTMPPNICLFGGDSGIVKSEFPTYHHPISISYNNGSQPSNFPQGMSSSCIPPIVPASNLEKPTASLISSPASVCESNRYSSSTFDHQRLPQAISSSFSASEKYNPLDASISISKVTGDIGSYHLLIHPTGKLSPSTFDRQHVPQSISSSSASGKINPLGTEVSISKLTGDMGSCRSQVIPRSKRSRMKKRKRKKLSMLLGCTDGEKYSKKLVASRSKRMPEKLSQMPVSFGPMDRVKNCSQKPVSTSTKITVENLLLKPVTGRKCLHCEISKTPQWRHGPMGPKTLCNACGVRYRSGRLFPEYRPVASPTFVASLHSNTHTKVMEIRNKSCNEETAGAGTDAATSPPPEFVPMSSYLFD